MHRSFQSIGLLFGRGHKIIVVLQEYSRSFEDVSSNTVIYFRGIPKEFRGNMTVLLEISDKDPLYSHCYQVKH